MNTTPTTPTEALTAALAVHPEATAAELALAAGIGGSTASKHLATLERDGVVVRHLGGHEGGRRTADRWVLVDAAASTAPSAEDVAPATDESGASRLHKGELSTLVLDYLKAHAGEAIGKALSRSSGAVANACQRLEASGSLRLVNDSPRRYDRRSVIGASAPRAVVQWGRSVMAISKDNRALRCFLGWIAEGDLEVVVWRTDDETPVLVSLVDINEALPHAVTL